MRQALIRKARPGLGAARPYQRSAPVKGWMSSENLADMDEDACYVMDNWFPETESIRVRRGSTTFATLPTTDPVRTVMAWEAGGVTEVFAAQGTNIYDVTAGGTITVADVSTQTSDKYIFINYVTSGDNYLVAANGTDDPVTYDGSVWDTVAITGVAGGADTLNYVFSYKQRLFFLQNDTADAYFLGPDAIAGSADVVSLGGYLTLGGSIIAGSSLAVNSGFGPEDYCVFVSDQGEVVLFAGTDPADPAEWSLKGVYRISRPIGNRCLIRIAGDIGVLCADGLVSLTKAISLDLAAQDKGAYSGNIRTAFNNQYNLTGGLFGWQILAWPTAHMAIVNVPITLDTESQQFVMNVLTGAWARYTGMNASCFCLGGTVMYFGSVDGKVITFETGNSDNGETVNARCIPAFSGMKSPGNLKHVKNAQVFFRGSGQYTIGLNIAADFRNTDLAVETQPIANTVGSLWDTALWDSGTWGTSSAINVRWLGIAGGGYFLAPVIFAQTGNDTNEPTDIQFLSLSLLYETGAIFG